jgi:hypothetical protein
MDDMDKIYDTYKINKNKLKVDNWVVVDEEYYYKYKDKLKITDIKLYSGKSELTGKEENYIIAETKTEYVLIKYNSNFVAVNICEREYDLTKSITLVLINSNSVSNIENNTGKIPPIKELIKVLGWKATRKAIINLEEFN